MQADFLSSLSLLSILIRSLRPLTNAYRVTLSLVPVQPLPSNLSSDERVQGALPYTMYVHIFLGNVFEIDVRM